MLRQLIKLLIRTIANTFFRRVDVVGLENVPGRDPVIFAGNHPNALMDGWLLTARCERWPLHFMASAKLWRYPLLGRAMNAMGAVPVYPRSEFGEQVDNTGAFEKLYEVIEAGNCMGVFPEGISHAESQLAEMKTGTARIALEVAARGKVKIIIMPCGLNYIHRHRFRSQVLIEFGEPIVIDDYWLDQYRDDQQTTVRHLTEFLAQSLAAVTLNAPDWRTLQNAQTARRLYKPAAATLSPEEYVELSRRFVEGVVAAQNDPELQPFLGEIEEYQAHLDSLGLKDYQLRQPVMLGKAYRRIVLRAAKSLVLLPLAVPAAVLHLPVAWIASIVGNRFSYEMDDIATLKVFATIALLPAIYIAIAIYVGNAYGLPWGIAAIVILTISFFATIRLLEMQAILFKSISSLFRLTRLREDVAELRKQRADLVGKVRDLADRLAEPSRSRMFTQEDFSS